MADRNRKILVTGAVGQVGTELVPALRRRYGHENVIAAGHRTPPEESFRRGGPFVTLDATDKDALRALIRSDDVGTVYHLATLLSADGEKDPERAWRVNVGSLKNVLDLGVEFGMGPDLLAELHRRFRTHHPSRRYAAADGPRAHHHVRGQQGCGRESVQLLPRQVRPRCARPPLSGARQLRSVLRRRNDGLLGGDLHRGRHARALHLLRRGRHRVAPDVHGRCHSGDDGAHGGGRLADYRSYQLQRLGAELHGRRARRGGGRAGRRVHVRLRTRLSAGHCRFLARLHGRFGGPPRLGMEAGVRPSRPLSTPC